MRYDLKKFLFFGLSGDREVFFEKAQEMGIIHFISIADKKIHEVPEDVQNVIDAIKILRGLPTAEQVVIDEYALADGLAEKILGYKHHLEKLAEDERVYRLDISRVEIFGDFSLDELAYIEKETGRKAQFFCAKSGIAKSIDLPLELIYVGTDHALDYFMALNKEPKQYPRMSELHIEHPVGELKRLHRETVNDILQTEHRLKEYAKYNSFLHHALINKLNQHHLLTAEKDVKFEIDGSLFVIEGWVPVNKLPALNDLVKNMNVQAEEIAIEKDESIPTYLENEGYNRIGEDLVHIYDTPSNKDKDPSLWVLVFFSFFFAFIVGDGGYGLIFLLTALFIHYRMNLKTVGKRVTKLIVILAISCAFWGLFTNSFFGIPLSMDNPLRKFSLLQWMVEKKAEFHIKRQDDVWKEWTKEYPQLATIKDPHQFVLSWFKEKNGKPDYEIYNTFSDNVMFELAIFIGIIHISLSMLRYLNRNWASLGWLIAIVGAYLYFPGYLHATSLIHYIFGVNPETAPKLGLYLLGGGIALATIIALYKHKLLGILEPMTSIQIFSDSMSYLRLYALGLSGAMLSSTINELAGSMNIVFGIIVVIIGHVVNMVLSIMGGTIHGLRLNFLEWYHYSFEGGGKPFNPLRKLTLD
jgi:V/A-type H+/Na+-transporting ATPase subunit I